MYGNISYKKCKDEKIRAIRIKEEELKVIYIILTDNWRIVLPLTIGLYKSWEYQQSCTHAIAIIHELDKRINAGESIDLEAYMKEAKNMCLKTYKRNLPLQVDLGLK